MSNLKLSAKASELIAQYLLYLDVAIIKVLLQHKYMINLSSKLGV